MAFTYPTTGGLKSAQVNHVTGALAGVRNYHDYLWYEEFFRQLPYPESANLLASNAARLPNFDWIVSGTGVAGNGGNVSGTYFSTVNSGMGFVMACGSASNANIFLKPAQRASRTLWKNLVMPSAKMPILCFLMKTLTSLPKRFEIGMGLTNAYNTTTDADQVKFYYDSATSSTNLYIAQSVGGTDYGPYDTGIDLAASTYYVLELAINGQRHVEAFVNGDRVWQSETTSKTAMTTGINLKPIFGQKSVTAAAAKGLLNPIGVMIGRRV